MPSNSVKRIRISKGLTQRDLAYRIRASIATVSAAERGLVLSPALARRLAEVLGLSVEALLAPTRESKDTLMVLRGGKPSIRKRSSSGDRP